MIFIMVSLGRLGDPPPHQTAPRTPYRVFLGNRIPIVDVGLSIYPVQKLTMADLEESRPEGEERRPFLATHFFHTGKGA